MLENMQKYANVNRVEIIDENWRAYTNYGCEDVWLSFQDEGRTLKIFLKKEVEEEVDEM
jgi:hypothetical protein